MDTLIHFFGIATLSGIALMLGLPAAVFILMVVREFFRDMKDLIP